MQIDQRIQAGAVALAIFATTYMIGRTLAPDPEAIVADATRAIQLADRRPGRQLVFVYVGSSRCGPSNAADVPEDVRLARDLIRAKAIREGVGFVSIGVAREMDASAGIEHLAKIGGFDEVAAGQGELNQASAHFISRDHAGMAATPQIIVLERVLLAEGEGINPATFHERVLTRKIGRREIGNWRAAHALLPSVSNLDSTFVDARQR